MSCAELQQPTMIIRFVVLGGRIGAPEKAEEWQRRSPAKVEIPGMWDGKLGFLGDVSREIAHAIGRFWGKEWQTIWRMPV